MLTPVLGHPMVVYDVDVDQAEDLQWGQWGNEYGQTFVAPCDCSLVRATCRGTSDGNEDLDITFSVHRGWASAEAIGPARTIRVKDRGEAIAEWATGEVPLRFGNTYYLRMKRSSHAKLWACYMVRDSYPHGSATVCGHTPLQPWPDRDIIGSLVVDAAPANLKLLSVEATAGGKGVTANVVNAGERAAVVVATGMGSFAGLSGGDELDPQIRDAQGKFVGAGEQTTVPVNARLGSQDGARESGVWLAAFDGASNLLRNPSFEFGMTGWRTWQTSKKTKTEYQVETDTGLSAQGASQLRMGFPECHQRRFLMLADSYSVAVDSNTEYLVGGAYRMTGDANPDVAKLISIVEESESGEVLQDHPYVLGDVLEKSRQWRPFAVLFTPGAQTDSVRISLRITVDHESGPEYICWDSLYLVRLGDVFAVDMKKTAMLADSGSMRDAD